MEMTALSRTGRRLVRMYERMLDHFGPQDWWPADSPLEMMVGAVLTQNTNWGNVEKALANLKGRGWLSMDRLHLLPNDVLADAIRPAGYFNIKAGRLKNLIRFMVDEYGGDVPRMLEEEPRRLRRGLLGVKGIGPETADSIVLYAAEQPVFVIDAYTHRILNRHGLADEQGTYDELQALFTDALPEDVPLYQEFHALIVRTGKEYCRKRPLCDPCPLHGME